MIKKLQPILLLLVPVFVFSQTKRIEIEGFTLVPKDQNPIGITVFNNNSQKGAITNYLGQFFLKVAKNDTLLISAIQYKSFKTVVTQTMIDDKKIVIEMKPYINELGEVVIYKKDFIKGWDLSYETLEYKYDYRNDRFSRIERNVAAEALGTEGLQNGLNIAGLVALAASALFKKKKNTPFKPKKEYLQAVLVLREKFDTDFYIQTFGIPKQSVQDFIYYLGEIGIPETLLKPENELELINYIQQKAKKYKQLQKTTGKE